MPEIIGSSGVFSTVILNGPIFVSAYAPELSFTVISISEYIPTSLSVGVPERIPLLN